MPTGPLRLRDHLEAALAHVRRDASGEVTDDPAPSADIDPESTAVALASTDGQVVAVGDHTRSFTIQSIAKPFAYGIALSDVGFDAVHAKVDVEPSGEAYHRISLDPETKRPDNPMINAGALAAHALVMGENASEQERSAHILDVLSELADRQLSVDEQMYEAEAESSHRNMAIAHLLRAEGVLPDDPMVVFRGYTRQCSILVTVEDLALMGATLACGGRQPRSGRRVFSRDVVRQVLGVMLTSGMYDDAGDWTTSVGIPAKSGVAGGILGAVPGRVGIAACSPRLDDHGTSVRGRLLFEHLTHSLGLHLLDDSEPMRFGW